MKALIFTLLTTTLLTLPSHAGPDKTSLDLMSAPATVWDMGMLRLEIQLKRIKTLARDLKAFQMINIRYNYDDDDIEVSLVTFKQYDFNTASSMCEAGLTTLQSNAGVNPDTGEAEQPATASRWSDLFHHIGFTNTNQNIDYNNLDKKFKLTCQVGLDPEKMTGGFMRYMGRKDLLSTSISEQLFMD